MKTVKFYMWALKIWLIVYANLLFFYRTQVQFLAPISGSLQPPIIPVSGAPRPSSDLYSHPHMSRYTHTHTDIHININ